MTTLHVTRGALAVVALLALAWGTPEGGLLALFCAVVGVLGRGEA